VSATCMIARPRLLDLYSGAGGTARGYQMAGFHVTGVDIAPQPRYVGDEFHLADALTFPLDGYDAIHASPPCQRYSRGTVDKERHPDLLPPTRARLAAQPVPWVIENVPGAPMRADYRLCGCMFGLPGLRRERWFETSWHGFDLRPPCHHPDPIVTVIGHGPNQHSYYRHLACGPEWERLKRRAMGIDWMNRDELAEAIPPAYAAFIGTHLLAHLAERASAP
jgi:DNA (cytosine-5)-methyltransferase 1